MMIFIEGSSFYLHLLTIHQIFTGSIPKMLHILIQRKTFLSTHIHLNTNTYIRTFDSQHISDCKNDCDCNNIYHTLGNKCPFNERSVVSKSIYLHYVCECFIVYCSCYLRLSALLLSIIHNTYRSLFIVL